MDQNREVKGKMQKHKLMVNKKNKQTERKRNRLKT